jgi:DHA1 family inner membrane transport protein
MSVASPRDRIFKSPADLVFKLGLITFCRLVLNTSRRFAYPFAPALSRGLGVDLTTVTNLIAVNQATGVLSVFFGPLADKLGYRLMMMAALGLLGAGMLAAGIHPTYVFALGALLLAGLAKNIFDPAIQAYVGHTVPFQRRGLVIGVLEFSWAASSLLGIPAAGFLIDKWGWDAPFLAMGIASLLGLLLMRLFIPKVQERGTGLYHALNYWDMWRLLFREKTARGAMAYIFLVSLANDNLFVVYGAWLEKDFGLSVVALGLGTTVLGAAELFGEFLTASLADRLGLKRTVLIGLAVSSAAYLILPFIGVGIGLALGGLGIIFLAFEFTLVTSLSLATELLPQARATMMAGFLASAGLGRVAGALIGVRIWLAGGITTTAIVSAGCGLLALLCLWRGLIGWPHSDKFVVE